MALPDINDLSSYGGVKINYAPVEDIQTEHDANDHDQSMADVAAMVPTALKGFVRFTTSATTPTLLTHNSQWGNSAPVTPIVARTGTGVFTLTFPASVNDQLSVAHVLSIRGAAPHLEGNTFANSVRAAVTSANVITVYTAASGVAADIAGSNVLVLFL